MEILVTVATPADFDERVQQLAGAATVVYARRGDPAYDEALQGAEILLGWPPEEGASQISNLRWIQLPSAGANRYVGRIPKTILLTTASGVYGVPVSEHVFALMLGVARTVPKYVRDQTERRWEPSPTSLELFGSTCGVLGLGDIGLAVAARAKVFGMRVLAARRTPEGLPQGVDQIFGPDELEGLLFQCDFVVNTLPETSSTRALLDRKMLRAIKRGGVLVNVGRGSTIEEPALVEALRDGHLAGAGLDVFEEEPLPKDSPLWAMPNVIITPHVGGTSPRGDERVAELFLDNLRRFVEGTTLQNLVDHELGY